MVEPDLVDHPNVQALVMKARDHLAAGDDKEAARLLTDAAYHTHDPEIEQQVHELAAKGLERAGRFGCGFRRPANLAPLQADRSAGQAAVSCAADTAKLRAAATVG